MNIRSFKHKALINLWNFSKIMALILVSIKLFGKVNTLPAVSIAVAWLMFPNSNLEIKKSVMIFNMIFLFLLGALGAQLVNVNPYIAGIGYLLITLIILSCSLVPFKYQPSIPFLLNFVFCQSQPVYGRQFVMRILCILIGSIFVTTITLYNWKKYQYGTHGRTLKQQIIKSKPYLTYILKMAIGLATAMTLADVLNFVKPLWITIVVMSLIEFDSKQVYEKIHDRFIGTLLGIFFFVLIIKILLPSNLDSLFILLMGYVSFFFTHYRTKTIVNAISALTASLVLLNTPIAIFDRVICLVIGILIVIVIEWNGDKIMDIFLKK